MNAEQNKTIFEFLNPEGCWHEVENRPIEGESWHLSVCNKCDQYDVDVPEIDYASEHGFFLLLKGLEEKGCGVELYTVNTRHSNTVLRELRDRIREQGLERYFTGLLGDE